MFEHAWRIEGGSSVDGDSRSIAGVGVGIGVSISTFPALPPHRPSSSPLAPVFAI